MRSESNPTDSNHFEAGVEVAQIRTQAELNWELDALVRAMVDRAPLIAFVKDEGGRYLYANGGFEELLGKTRREIVGHTDDMLFAEEAARQNRQNDRHVLLTGDPMRSVDVIAPAGKGPREWSCIKFPFVGAASQRLIGGVVTDVTDQRRAHRTVTESHRRLKAALEAGYDAFYAMDAVRNESGQVVDFIYLDLNRNGERMLNRSRWEVVNHRLSDVVSASLVPSLLTKFSRVLETRVPLEEEFPLEEVAASTRWFRHQIVPLGEGIAITMREVTEQKRAEATAREHTRILENALGGIAFIAEQGYFTYENAEFCRMLGLSAEELDGQSWEVAIAPEDLDRFAHALERSNPEGKVEIECRGRREDGAPLYMRCMLIQVINNGGADSHYLFAEDITEKRRYEAMLEEQNRQLIAARADLQAANARLQELATTDGLTGVRNRREFQDRLAQQVSAAKRYGSALSMILLDVDRFKLYNDAFGHPAGDEVLRKVAVVLNDNARSFDVVARYGGEEFAVLLPETDIAGAMTIAERFRVALESETWPHRSVTASFGCAELGEKYGTMEALVQAADEALYASKEAGRNRVTAAP